MADQVSADKALGELLKRNPGVKDLCASKCKLVSQVASGKKLTTRIEKNLPGGTLRHKTTRTMVPGHGFTDVYNGGRVNISGMHGSRGSGTTTHHTNTTPSLSTSNSYISGDNLEAIPSSQGGGYRVRGTSVSTGLPGRTFFDEGNPKLTNEGLASYNSAGARADRKLSSGGFPSAEGSKFVNGFFIQRNLLGIVMEKILRRLFRTMQLTNPTPKRLEEALNDLANSNLDMSKTNLFIPRLDETINDYLDSTNDLNSLDMYALTIRADNGSKFVLNQLIGKLKEPLNCDFSEKPLKCRIVAIRDAIRFYRQNMKKLSHLPTD